RLRERLRSERPGWMPRLADWISGFGPLTVRPISVAVGLALVLLAIGWWTWQRRQAVGPTPGATDVARETPTPQPNVWSHDEVIVKTPKSGEISKRRTSVHPTGHLAVHLAAEKSNGNAPSDRREERVGEMVKD